VFTCAVGRVPEGDVKLVLTITDDSGRPVRRLDVAKTTGIQRVTWNLRGEPPAAEGRGGGRGAEGPGGGAGEQPGGQGFGGRGGPPQGPLVAPGRYRATLGRQSGDTVTALGQQQTFLVVPLGR
jgi:hypothetical protein